jgi:hypothetical protein
MSRTGLAQQRLCWADRHICAGASQPDDLVAKRESETASQGVWLLKNSLGDAVTGGGQDAVALAIRGVLSECGRHYDLPRARVETVLDRAASTQVLQRDPHSSLRAALLACIST